MIILMGKDISVNNEDVDDIYDNMFIKINKVKIYFVNSLYEKKTIFFIFIR